jgi:hypothetical protein
MNQAPIPHCRRRRVSTRLAAVLLVVALASAGATAGRADQAGSSKAAPQMSPEEMQKWMATTQPGPNHELLGRLAGKWKTKISMWMGPGDPQATEGTATYEWTLGGRYLLSHQTGNFAGMPYEGMGIDGYDNGTKEFFSLWMDNMGTGVMHLKGQKDPDGQGWSLSGPMFDPAQGKEVPVRETVRLDGKDKYTYSMFTGQTGPDGKAQEFKVMEISATRM